MNNKRTPVGVLEMILMIFFSLLAVWWMVASFINGDPLQKRDGYILAAVSLCYIRLIKMGL